MRAAVTEHRRVGSDPGRFSSELRSTIGGGTIPPGWGCRVVDLDEFYAHADGELFRVMTGGRVWAWYRLPVQVVALAEQKSYLDPQQSFDVTRAIARGLDVESFRVVAQRDGTLVVTDSNLKTESFSTTRDFVDWRIRPLIPTPPPF